MEREEIVERLNKSFQNNTLNADEYLPLLTEFLECEHKDKVDKIIQLVLYQPLLLGQTILKVKEYFINKYEIFTLSKIINNQYINLCFY